MGFDSSFADYLLATRKIKVTSVDDILNEATKQRYIFSEMLKNRDVDQITKGGSSLVDQIEIADNGSFAFYRPGEDLTPVDADVMKEISLKWRYAQCNFSWLEEEENNNEGDPDRFFTLRKSKESSSVTSFLNGVEAALLATPSNADMESTSGKQPYSIQCFVNEFTSGLPTGFTTIMGQDPTTTTCWKPVQVGYTASKIANPTDPNGLLSALDDAFMQIGFDPISFNPAKEFFESDQLERVRIYTQKDGVKTYNQILRASNDRTARPEDAAVGDAMWAGKLLRWIPTLDTAALYNGTGALAASHTAGVANAGFPRFKFLNFKYLYPLINKDRFFDAKQPINGGANRPNQWVQYYFTQMNVWCRSRKRHAEVFPNAA